MIGHTAFLFMSPLMICGVSSVTCCMRPLTCLYQVWKHETIMLVEDRIKTIHIVTRLCVLENVACERQFVILSLNEKVS